MSTRWKKYPCGGSSIVIIMVLAIFAHPVVGQTDRWNLTDDEINKRSLYCWECNVDAQGVGPGGPCTGTHEQGASRLCPPSEEEYQRDVDYNTIDDYKCMILKTVAEKNNKIEIIKGCSSTVFELLQDAELNVKRTEVADGDCAQVLGDFNVEGTVRYYEYTICFCKERDCNRYKIKGVGEEDIHQRDKMKNSVGSLLLRGALGVNILWIIQLCLAAATGILLRQ